MRMNENPFLISGPAIISFSGGRTSGKMLYEIVQAHGGTLPDDVKVCFANTGKERKETLLFVHKCSSHWGVHVHWLQWCDGKPCFEEVDYASAARAGAPFQALIAKKKRLPNWMERWCTQYLKVHVLTGFAKAQCWLPGHYNEVIGLRYDEGHRILKAIAMGEKDKRHRIYPLSRARITRGDVMAWWAAQPFDLELEPWEGNCDLCFMKGRGIRKRIIRLFPNFADWWNAQEIEQDGFFDRRDRVRDLIEEVRQTPDFLDEITSGEHDVECDLLCGAA